MTRKDLLSWLLFTSSDAQNGKESKEGNVLPRTWNTHQISCLQMLQPKLHSSISKGQSVNPETITLTHSNKVSPGKASAHPWSKAPGTHMATAQVQGELLFLKVGSTKGLGNTTVWARLRSKELLAKFGCDKPISQSTPTAFYSRVQTLEVLREKYFSQLPSYVLFRLCWEGWPSPHEELNTSVSGWRVPRDL